MKPADEQARIYQESAEEYDELISAEDADGKLLLALHECYPVDGARVADIGAGTGRISRLLARRASSLTLVERASPMLQIARRHLEAMGVPARFVEADARELPLTDGCVDLAIAAWVFGHFRLWMPTGWRAEVGRAIREMQRIVQRGGAIIVIETLGTGAEQPRQHPGLDEYFEELVHLGFTRSWIRTDYVFANAAEAARICGRFFGSELEAKILADQSPRVPECTALFCRRTHDG